VLCQCRGDVQKDGMASHPTSSAGFRRPDGYEGDEHLSGIAIKTAVIGLERRPLFCRYNKVVLGPTQSRRPDRTTGTPLPQGIGRRAQQNRISPPGFRSQLTASSINKRKPPCQANDG